MDSGDRDRHRSAPEVGFRLKTIPAENEMLFLSLGAEDAEN